MIARSLDHTSAVRLILSLCQTCQRVFWAQVEWSDVCVDGRLPQTYNNGPTTRITCNNYTNNNNNNNNNVAYNNWCIKSTDKPKFSTFV